MTVRVRKRGANAFADRVEAFAEGLRQASVRKQSFIGPRPQLDQSPQALQEALETLRVQHEELLVAEEELRSQVDELTRVGLQISAERERYSDLFERSDDCFVVTDRRGVVRDANAAALTFLGGELRHLRGKPFIACIAPRDASTILQLLVSVEHGKLETRELQVQTRGRSATMMTAEVGLTARGHRLLWRLRRAATEAEGASPQEIAIARAVRDKAELLLRETRIREDLERANRAKDKFIAVLAHDLRAPLHAVLGWTQLLRREMLDQDGRNRAFETIERNAKAQATLVEELLDISRMAADRLPLSLTAVDVSALVGRVVDGAHPRAEEGRIDIAVDAEPELVVMGDRQRLEQVITNLLSNAIKFTPPEGHVRVTVKRDGMVVQIVVADDGKGIAPAALPHVFEMYGHERSRPMPRDGLGLGLYIVRRLVELQDGNVTAASEGEGRGSTFTVSLPLREGIKPSSTTTLPEVRADLRDLRVLVVDDEQDSRELLVAVLRRAGAAVAAASGAKSALDLFAHWTPDVVVSDLEMPDGDGCELIAMLRDLEPSIAAVAVSGFTTAKDADRALAAGFDVHIGKPVDTADLVEAIADIAPVRR